MEHGKHCTLEEKHIIVKFWNEKLTEFAQISKCSRKIVYKLFISFKANIIMPQKIKKRKSRVMKTTEFINRSIVPKVN